MAGKGLVAFVLWASLMFARPASAQQVDEVGAGDRVYAAQQADLKIEAEVVATARKNDVLSVRQVSGKWLWVETAGGERGWIDRQFVTLTSPAPTLNLTPQSATPAAAPTPLPTDPAVTRPSGQIDNASASGTVEPGAGQGDLEENLLLAVGALSGQNVYVTYAYIGTVADGYANDVYSAEQVQELMNEIVGLCSTAGRYVRTLASADVSEEDRASVEQMVGILDLLRQEAEALSAFVKSQSQDDLTRYEAARAAAWPQIQSALGIR